MEKSVHVAAEVEEVDSTGTTTATYVLSKAKSKNGLERIDIIVRYSLRLAERSFTFVNPRSNFTLNDPRVFSLPT